MKNIFIAAIFLFSQTGLSAENANKVKAKKFQIENLKFSELLLTKEEIIHLNQEDQAKYIFAMISLGQILEGSQQFQMGYEDKVLTAQHPQPREDQFSRYSSIFYVLIPPAQAWVFLARAATVIAPVLTRAGAWVLSVGEKVMAKAATKAQSGAQMAFEFTPPKATLKNMSTEVATHAKNLKTAQEKAVTALKKAPASATPLKEEIAVNKARAAFVAVKETFLKAGGTEAQFAKVASESGLKKVLTWPFRNAKSLTVGGFAAYGADTLILDKLGVSLSRSLGESIDQQSMSIENWAAGTDLSGPALVTLEQLKAGDSRKEKGKTCLFGGVPSMWKEFSEGEIKCTRPAEGSNENCKQEDGKFQCPSHGFKLASGSIDSGLCIDSVKLTNLTVRCVAALKTILETKQVVLDSKDAAIALQKSYGDVIKGIEARDRMKNEQGETKSIFEYCEADSVTQKEECGAIKEFVGLLKSTNVVSLYETRQQVADIAPEPAAGAPEAGSVDSKQ